MSCSKWEYKINSGINHAAICTRLDAMKKESEKVKNIFWENKIKKFFFNIFLSCKCFAKILNFNRIYVLRKECSIIQIKAENFCRGNEREEIFQAVLKASLKMDIIFKTFFGKPRWQKFSQRALQKTTFFPLVQNADNFLIKNFTLLRNQNFCCAEEINSMLELNLINKSCFYNL